MNTLLQQPEPALSARLRELYHDSSKHSVYQSVPSFIATALGYQEEIHSLWRSDAPRHEYLARRLVLREGASVADIGANTGFFSLNLAHSRPDLRITAFEMNPRHAEFIALSAAAFSLDGVAVKSQSCDLAGLEQMPEFDAVYLLNVLHHAGFDFDAGVPDDNVAFTGHAVKYLSRLRTKAARLVFQIGSNRGGDKSRPLFPRDDDASRIAWIAAALDASGWRIRHIAYATLVRGAVVFRDVPADFLETIQDGDLESQAITRFLESANTGQFPGEFHRRPLVIADRAHTTQTDS